MKRNNILKILVIVLSFSLILVLGYTFGNIIERMPQKEHREKDITFVGIIEKIDSKEKIYVKGTNENPKDFRKTYELKLNDKTIYMYNNDNINIDDFNVGNEVKVTFKGEYADIYPPLLDRVSKIELLNKEISNE